LTDKGYYPPLLERCNPQFLWDIALQLILPECVCGTIHNYQQPVASKNEILLRMTPFTMTPFDHCGLYFSEAQVMTARNDARHPPFKQAWKRLDAPLDANADLLEQAMIHALRWRFHKLIGEGETAVGIYHRAGQQAADRLSLLDGCIHTVALAQLFELLRDHPLAEAIPASESINLFIERASQLDTVIQSMDTDTQGIAYLERIWAALVMMTAGVVSEDIDLRERAAAVYHHIIDHNIRPAGFIPQLVDGKDGGSLLRTLIALKGLTLLAEAAQYSGLDLWSYNNRGVSLTTAALYPLYYYFYPEKWQWDSDLDPDTVKADFRTHAGYLEPLNRHIGRPTKAIDLILAEIRPILDPYGGGLLTLSHGVRQRRGLFG
jgi:hypothetical protein